VTVRVSRGATGAPRGVLWTESLARWKALVTIRAHLRFCRSTSCSRARAHDHVRHQSRHGGAIGGAIPKSSGDAILDKALEYMGFRAGDAMLGKPVNPCSSAAVRTDAWRTSRPRPACSKDARWRRASPADRTGFTTIKRDAEAAGYAEVFRAAGADWRESGCSMCLGMNGDTSGRASIR